jgi:hypothetical protein
LVSIVTPSFEQGRFLRAAIDSVLSQSYPAIEYRVVDGGSIDETLAILRSYDDRIRWTSEPDSGQSDAIDKGFSSCRGDLLGWLNADDTLEPGAVERVVAAFAERPDAGLIYGEGRLIDESGEQIGPFSEIEPFGLWRLVHGLDYVLQPAAFFRAVTYRSAGGLDRSLHWTMDWDLWIRLAAEAEVIYLPEVLAQSRIWGDTKTSTGGWKRLREIGNVARRHAGRFWTPGVRLYALDTLGQNLRRGLPRAVHRAVDGALHRAALRIVTRMAAFPDGWLGPKGSLLVPRRWSGGEIELEAHRMPTDRPIGLEVAVVGGESHRLELDEPGAARLEFELPPDPGRPFAELRVLSDFWFRGDADPRRLAVRLASQRPLGRGGALR